MYIKELKTYQFRNLVDASYVFSPRINFIVGSNGQGKTNLIEAVSILSTARSFRTTKLQELIAHGKHEMSIFSSAVTRVGDLDLGVSVQNGRRSVFLQNQQQESIATFVGNILSVSFAPSDIEIVKGAPGERRRFLDRLVIDLRPQAMMTILEFAQAIRQKNVLLRDPTTPERLIDPWNQIIAKKSAELLQARQEVLQRLQEKASQIYQKFGGTDGALSLRIDQRGDPATGELEIYALLQRLLEKEKNRQGTLWGPHKDDVTISLGDASSRAFASQGQSRSIVLSLKLAAMKLIEEQRQEAPIILLDDVDSELDEQRSTVLFDLIHNAHYQFLITGTDRAAERWLKTADVTRFQIAAGKLT